MDIQELIKQAIELHRCGDLAKAESLYLEVLAVKPKDPDANHLLGVVSHQRGEYETALDLICKALAVREDHPQSYNNLGMVFKELGRYNDAQESLRRAIDLQPDYAEAYNNLGTVYKKLGRLDEAEVAYNQAVELHPEYINALNNLGNLFLESRNLNKALTFYSRALCLDPDLPLSHYNLACALIKLGRFDEAEAALLQVVKEDNEHVEALNSLGRLYCLRFRFDRSIASFQRSIEIQPDSEGGYIGLGNTFSSINRFSKAAYYLEKAISIAPNSVEALNSLGLVYSFLGKIEEAFQYMEKASQISPDNEGVLCNLATLYMAQGLFADSASVCKKVLKQKPDSANAYYQLAQVTNGKKADELIRTISTLLDPPQTSPLNQVKLQFAMAKLLEEQEKYDQAFACLVEANQVKRKTFIYSLEQHQEMVKRICEVYDENALHRFSGKGFGSNVSIFIVGMPRSGSTLVEQILASHPDVHGGGELSLFTETVTEYFEIICQNEIIPPDINLKAGDLLELGKRYAKQLQSRAPKAKRITDKMLGNYMQLGLISLILPKAKIVHCRRNPADTCFSIYKKLFNRGHQYAYDLQEVGGCYLLYDRLMQHWKKVLPGRFLDFYCEDLVYDQETETRRLLDYCGLEWHEGCMRFYDHKRAVFTASSVQVRKPITDISVELWRKYEKGLHPLLSILAPCLK